jgi:hypothetical protein
MYVHPLVALFMLVWLVVTGYGALQGESESPIALKMFGFGAALTVLGFFPEAIYARRLISIAVCNRTASAADQQQGARS